MTRHIAFIIFTLLANASTAGARDVKIDSTTINLTVPQGFCELDENSDRVNGLRELLGERNQLLAAYADCRSNLSLPLDNFAHYIMPAVARNVILPADGITKICAWMRKSGEERLAVILRDRATDIAKVFAGLKINESRFIGVVAESPAVCYTAVVQKLVIGAGKENLLLGISAAMNIKGKFVVYHLYSPYISADTVATMLDRQKSNVSAFFAANPK
jgi:hypothetical protein